MLKENFTKTKAWAAYVREDIHFISEIPPVLRKIEFFSPKDLQYFRETNHASVTRKSCNSVLKLVTSKSKFYFYLISTKNPVVTFYSLCDGGCCWFFTLFLLIFALQFTTKLLRRLELQGKAVSSVLFQLNSWCKILRLLTHTHTHTHELINYRFHWRSKGKGHFGS